jgi:hypothetical protein
LNKSENIKRNRKPEKGEEKLSRKQKENVGYFKRGNIFWGEGCIDFQWKYRYRRSQ